MGALALVSLAYASQGCGDRPANAPAGAPPAPAGASPAAAVPADDAAAPLPPTAYEAALPEGVRARLFEKFTGDFDQMVARRLIRVGTPFNRTFYFVDKGVQRGMAYELGLAFEEQLNKKLKTTNATKVNLAFIPLPRDGLAAALREGKVDCAVAQVVIRPELQAIVDFTNPTRTNVSEVVVSGPGAPAIALVDDLSGKEVYARKDSSALGKPGRTERQPQGQGSSPGRDPGSSGEPRRRRPARDDERRPRPDGGRPRLPR